MDGLAVASLEASISITTLGPKHSPVRERVSQTASPAASSSSQFASDHDWLVKIIAIQDRFVLGLYRREMKAISYLRKIEKTFGVAATTRNWNTIEKVAKILQSKP
jgi:uncharacterized protein (DUF1697 family)